MKVVIADSTNMILSTIYDVAIRIPVVGDHVCYSLQAKSLMVGADDEVRDGIVEKVMIDYAQDVAIVTVKAD